MKTTKILITAILSLTATSVIAADGPIGTLRDVSGQVMVAHGKTFAMAPAGSALYAGDRVLTLNKGSASIALKSASGTCSIALRANQSVQISASPCATVLASIEGLGLGQAEALGATAATAPAATGLTIAGLTGGTLVAAGAAVVVGTGLVINKVVEDRRAASPN